MGPPLKENSPMVRIPARSVWYWPSWAWKGLPPARFRISLHNPAACMHTRLMPLLFSADWGYIFNAIDLA